MELSPETPQEERSVAAFEALWGTCDAWDRAILWAVSLSWGGCSRSALAKILSKARVRSPAGRCFTNKTVEPHIEALAQRGALEVDGSSLVCPPQLSELALLANHGAPELMQLATAFDELESTQRSSWYYSTVQPEITPKKLRVTLCSDAAKADDWSPKQLDGLFSSDGDDPGAVLEMCQRPFGAAWLLLLPEPLQVRGLATILDAAALTLEAAPRAVAQVNELLRSSGQRPGAGPARLAARQLLLSGRLAEAEPLVDGGEGAEEQALRGWFLLVRGTRQGALGMFRAALKQHRKALRRRQVSLPGLPGLLFAAAALNGDTPAEITEAERLVASGRKEQSASGAAGHAVLEWLHGSIRGDQSVLAAGHRLRLDERPTHRLAVLFDGLARVWLGRKAGSRQLALLRTLRTHARSVGYGWVAGEVDQILLRLGSSDDRPSDGPSTEVPALHLVDLLEQQEPWKASLRALAGLVQQEVGPATVAATAGSSRLVWFVFPAQYFEGGYDLEPREQRLSANGRWTKGRPVALKRLREEPEELDFLTEQDRRICADIEVTAEAGAYRRYYGTRLTYSLDADVALPALVGHPLVFWKEAPEQRVEIVERQPELIVARQRGGLHLSLSVWPQGGSSVVITQEGPHRLAVLRVSAPVRLIAATLGEDGLRVPRRAEAEVGELVGRLAALLPVQSDVDTTEVQARDVEADPCPRVLLQPSGRGLVARLRVRPLGDGSTDYRPGIGRSLVLTELHGEPARTQRDLAEERTRAKVVLDRCPALGAAEQNEDEWLIADPEGCLELLEELRALGEAVRTEWPEGQTLRITPPAEARHLRLTLKSEAQWLHASGTLQLDDGRVLQMHTVLSQLEQSTGRFVPLGEGEFLALTGRLRRQLETLRAHAQRRGKGIRLHALAGLALEGLSEEAGELHVDAAYAAHLERLRGARELRPQVPSTFEAELRGYQHEGFVWLARLANLGVGACLADDMGLGKTVQALALLLRRAPDGPALVLAPTSVCAGWRSEACRFAPSLQMHELGDSGRAELVAGLGPFDVLICSYGLLRQEAGVLAGHTWRTLVLDEAQAIKNQATKVSRAALALQADFRLIATGTPIENHLGELWSLMHFLNPGLLGSRRSFEERFVLPIERDQGGPAQARLRSLLRPIILRRTKGQVLDELPERTEITRSVELLPDEAALYEALRRKGLATLQGQGGQPGQRRLQILAEITRLRRAACNSRLVQPKLELPSAKLALFDEILDELRAGHHRALVFSQFVSHLAILREHLDARGVGYQYLDGSTPARQRQRAVQAFQAGEGEVFLISLKAGGLGLNLTAADYVLHMDPWWNPAVEDQASDRAHRIGQHRPVTIYRLVTQGTIEEKIIELHRSKRRLADGLLEGTEQSARLSAEELLALLQAPGEVAGR